jgi:Flp pilus assembly protein TadG
MRPRLRPDRLQGDRGAVLVEAVFVFPVVFFITLAIFEFGLLFAAQSTSQSSTRQGARFAAANFAVAADKTAASDQVMGEVTKDLGALTGYDTPIQLLVYKSNANGDPVAGSLSACTASCFHYTWNGTAFVNDTALGVQWNNPQGCISSTLDSIGIYVEVRHSYVTGAFGSSQILKEHTVSRLEPLPLTQCP